MSRGERVAWQVDSLTRKVFVHSVTARLDPDEAQALRDAFDTEDSPGTNLVMEGLSVHGLAVRALLAAGDEAEAEKAINGLPQDIQDGLRDLSPVNYMDQIRAPLIAISHDRDDLVIPVDESRLLLSVLGQRTGVHYTEFAMFQHADPTKRKLSPPRLLWQLGKFYLWLFGVFRKALA
jgi:hypothetical protein